MGGRKTKEKQPSGNNTFDLRSPTYILKHLKPSRIVKLTVYTGHTWQMPPCAGKNVTLTVSRGKQVEVKITLRWKDVPERRVQDGR